MAKNLVLVESPAKARTINRYLGRNYVVEATVGHIRNLPKSKLGVDVDEGFKVKFVTIRGKGDIIKKIRSLSTKSDHIFIATDPDREGEAIALDIAEVVNGKKGANVSRVLFNEITKNGVKRGMDNPRSIDESLVDSQRARRVMDRIIGYQISPLLWRAILEESDNSLSAGRVQSVALRLICERDAEIDAFRATEYWLINGFFGEKAEAFRTRLHSIERKEIKVPPKPEMSEEDWRKFRAKYAAMPDEKSATEVYDRIKAKKRFEISDVTKKEQRRKPAPPFITSTLQAEASRALRMRPRQTMRVAQRLYEGVELGKAGSVGLITYMRTDSTRLSSEIVNDAREHIESEYGSKFLPKSGVSYGKKGQNVQDAHEAIRPTSLEYTPERVKEFLDERSFNLYRLIWNRFVASQMTPAILEQTTVEISADEFTFRASGQVVLFEGFMKVYFESEEKEDGAEEPDALPTGLEKGKALPLADLEKKQQFTKPSPRYSESSLIKELESKGIGRPSTYSTIVSTILDRNYVEQRERKLQSTELGRRVNEILVKNFPNIVDVSFTAKMEADLDKIAQGDLEYEAALKDFYYPFAETLEKAEQNMEKILCDKCGGEMTIKIGRYGKFLACTNYPECKNVKSLKDFRKGNDEPEFTGEKCPKCGARAVYRNGRFGRFIGCERYPDCDYLQNITLGVKCPKCEKGEITERKSKKGRSFYGCDQYPDCDYLSWSKPVDKKCPHCGYYFVESKYNSKLGTHLKCPKCNEIVEGES